MLRYEKLTVKAQEALQAAQEIAGKNGQQQLEPLHLLAALVAQPDGVVPPLLSRLGARPEALSGEIQTQIARLPKVSGVSQQYLSEATNQVLEKAFEEAEAFKDEYVSAEHILLAIAARESDPAAQLLSRHGASREAILQALTSVRGSHRVTSQTPESTFRALEQYSRDLTELARNYARLSPRADAGVCDINAVVETVAAGYATPDHGTTSGTATPIALQLDPQVPAVTAESLVMHRIVDNLVSNACDAAGHRPGAVTIATRWTGSEVRITVADRGCGMTPEELRRAFSDFFTTKSNGTGLGLSIVRRLVRDVHGVLSVDTAPGSGTQVTLVLPCSDTVTAAPLHTRAS